MKTETIYARVTPELARKVQAAAKAAGESDAFIMREALREYFAARPVNSAATLADAAVSGAISEVVAAPAPGPVSYKSKPKAARRSKSQSAPDSRKKAL